MAVTHHKITTLPDGTRRYSNGTRYKPVPLEERKIGVNKPDDPNAVRFHGRWYLPLPLKPDEQRRYMPETRPDSDAYDHMELYGVLHNCDVCARPAAMRWIKRWVKDKAATP